MVKLQFERHDGSYNDGNSHYWSEVVTLDLDEETVTVEREDTYYGQLAGYNNGDPNACRTERDVNTRPMKTLDADAQREVWETLEPFWSTGEKYPHRVTFSTFSRKHHYLVSGRLSKALELTEDTDHAHYDGASWLFVLPAVRKAIRVQVERTKYGRDTGTFFVAPADEFFVEE